MAIIYNSDGTRKADIIYGLDGSDTLRGHQGDDKIVGEQEDLIYSNIAGVVTIPPAVVFGRDYLYGDQGNDSLYGDLVKLAFIIEAGPEVSQILDGNGSIAPAYPAFSPITFGNDLLDGGVGDDLLVGDVDNILLRAQTTLVSAAAPLGNADATLQNISMTMGADNLYGGNGNDVLYGDVRIMTLESIAGIANDPSLGNQSANSRLQGITFQGGVDHLYGGNSDDVLVGDIGTLNLLSQAGDALGTGDQAISRLNGISPFLNTLTMGGDFLYGDNGNDTLYGDIDTMNLRSTGGTVNGGSSAQAQMIGITFNMGADKLYGGRGNDSIYGDIGALTFLAQGGNSFSAGGDTTAFIQAQIINPETQPVLFNMGADKLYGEAGNDHLVGDVGTLTIQGQGGSVSGSNTLSRALVTGTFFMGNDFLDGGNGDDTLLGDVENLSIIGQGGIVSEAGSNAVAIIGSKLTMGVDTLIGGNGNDYLYGDVGTFTVSYTGGTVTSTSTSPNAVALSGADPAGNYFIVLTMGADNLIGGNGDDFLYGDVGTWNISLTGGTNSGVSTFAFGAAAACIDSAVFTMGNDLMDGGAGNDVLYGDVGVFSAVLTPGTGDGTAAFIDNTKIQFGNDTLMGGAGDDILVGDIANPTQLNGFLNAPLGYVAPTANQLIFGNDTFVFSLGGKNGHDTILDMNGGAVSTATCIVTNVMDTLKFTDVMNVNGGALDFTDVDAQSMFSNSGGNLLMSFAGGSVLFANIIYAGQDSVMDITPNIVVTA